MQNETPAQALPHLTYNDLCRGLIAIAESANELAKTAATPEDMVGICGIEIAARHIIECLDHQNGRCLRG